MAKHIKDLFFTIILVPLVTWWMSLPYQGFMVYFLIPVLLLIFAVRAVEDWIYDDPDKLEKTRIAIWLTSVAIILVVHHIRSLQWREAADRVAHNVIEYSAREGHCPKSLDRWITPDEAKAIHLIYSCENGNAGLMYMDSFEAIARYYYRFDKRAWEWNSG